MIESHQDLLQKYYFAQRTVISEESEDVSGEVKELITNCELYANGNDLDASFLDEDKEMFFDDDE